MTSSEIVDAARKLRDAYRLFHSVPEGMDRTGTSADAIYFWAAMSKLFVLLDELDALDAMPTKGEEGKP